jgi:hypothetical protein
MMADQRARFSRTVYLAMLGFVGAAADGEPKASLICILPELVWGVCLHRGSSVVGELSVGC